MRHHVATTAGGAGRNAPATVAHAAPYLSCMERGEVGRTVAMAQGAYWAASGLWPIVDLRSFEAVTGPKRERWLVKTMGGLVAAVGATLLVAGARRRVTSELALLGAASAAALGGAGAWYAARGRIRSVYLADAALEAALLGAWGLAARRRRAAARVGVRTGVVRGAGTTFSA